MFTSCGKEEILLKCDTCFVNAYINGISWQADKLHAFYFETNEMNILAFSFDLFQNVREQISFQKLRPEVGTFRIVDRSKLSIQSDEIIGTFSTKLSDGDVLGGIYKVINEEESFLLLDNVDLENDIVEGRFQMSLVKVDDPDPSIGFPDTVRITRGIFRADIRRE